LELTGTAGQLARLPLPRLADDDRWSQLPATLVFVGVGEADPAAARRAGAAVARAAAPEATVAVADFAEFNEQSESGESGGAATTALVEGLALASYRHPFTGTGTGPKVPAAAFRLVAADEEDLAAGIASAEATIAARRW